MMKPTSPDSTLADVLMIEDDPMFAEIARAYLYHPAARGIVLHLASDLESGLAFLGKRSVDLVLLDLTLPESVGYTTFARVHHCIPQVPIIVLTGLDDDNLAERAVRGGAQDYLIKGELTPTFLARSIRYALERNKTAVRLAESERRYRAVVEDQTELVCRFDPAGRLSFVNRAFCRYFGAEPAELLGRVFFSLFPEDDHVEVATHLAAIDPAQPIRSREQRFRRCDGEARWLQWTDRALYDEGRLVEYQSVGRDVTDRKALEEQLRHAQKLEVVGQVVGAISHDFNNILTAIAGYSDLVLQRQEAGGVAAGRESEGLRKAVQQAMALTGRLLAFSRRQIVRAEVLDLNHVLGEVAPLLRQLVGERVVLDIRPGGEPLRIKADLGHLEQIIVNLAVNARDAMPDGGVLAISARRLALAAARAQELSMEPGECAELVVADTGCGMESGVLTKIFEPFFTTKDGGRGTGLGLSTVSRIVGENRGNVAVESLPGSGSTFRVYLPLTNEQPRPDEPSEAAAEAAVAGAPAPLAAAFAVPAVCAAAAEAILLVEDDEPVRSVLETILTRRAYRVRATSNAEEALQLLGTGERFDVLLTDVVMAGLSGPELASRARLQRPEMQVIFMSGYPDTGASLDSLLSSGIPMLQKPFSARRLLSKLDEVLGHPA